MRLISNYGRRKNGIKHFIYLLEFRRASGLSKYHSSQEILRTGALVRVENVFGLIFFFGFDRSAESRNLPKDDGIALNTSIEIILELRSSNINENMAEKDESHIFGS